MRQGGWIVAAVTIALLFVIGSVPVAADGPVADNRTTVRPDPDTDVIGWEAGYWHNESIAVDQTDGLSDAELDRYIARSMARVEFLRDREFKRSVSVTIQSRTEFQSRLDDRTRSDRYVAWHNQVWEALFIVGEDRNAQATLETIYGSSVLGFYTPGSESIRIITTTPSRPTLDNATLIHELTHALQDQYIGLTSEQFHRPTRDGRPAAEGIIEGEASYIARRYAQRCGRQWDCVASPARTDSGLQTDRNLGMLLTLYQPYSDGPVYIDHLRERGGWSAVANVYNRPPSSTEQTIHLTDTVPSSLTVDDTATDGWQRFDRYGDGGTETVGEAAIYAMFWYQSRHFDAPIVEWRSVRNVSSPLDVYDYRSRPSTGWANDRLIPYRRGDGSNASYGYVWVSVWDSKADARELPPPRHHGWLRGRRVSRALGSDRPPWA